MVWQLFWLMLGIGATTFGGGYAIIPVIQSQVVDRMHWITGSDFATGIAFGQLTPGPLTAFAGRWRKVPRVQAALKGLTVAVVAMLVGSIVTLGKSGLHDWVAVLLAVGSFVLTGPLKKDPGWSLGLGAVVGAVAYGLLR